MNKNVIQWIIVIGTITILVIGFLNGFTYMEFKHKQNLIKIIQSDKNEFNGNKLIVKRYDILNDKMINIGLLSPKISLDEKYGKHYITFDEIKDIDKDKYNEILKLENKNQINKDLNKKIDIIYTSNDNKLKNPNSIDFSFKNTPYKLFFEENNKIGQNENILYIQNLNKKRFYINIIYDSIENLDDLYRKQIKSAQIGLDGNIYFLIQNKLKEEKMFHNEIFKYNIDTKEKEVIYSSNLPLTDINFKVGKNNIYIAGNMLKTFNMKYLYIMGRRSNYNPIEYTSGVIFVYDKKTEKEYLIKIFKNFEPYIFFQ